MAEKLFSVCIPTYEMRGLGAQYLEHSFEILKQQTLQDFEVIISDHSASDEIKKVCHSYQSSFLIQYLHNAEKVGNSSANLNNAIKHATGKLIKILFQDDFLYGPSSLTEIAAHFDFSRDHWLVTPCEHSIDGKTFNRPYYPNYNDRVHLGENTIGSPSVLTIKNDHPLLFDENLIWLMDGDYYKRCYDAYGPPVVLEDINVVNRIGAHQVTNTLATEALRKKEHEYILKKYNQSA